MNDVIAKVRVAPPPPEHPEVTRVVLMGTHLPPAREMTPRVVRINGQLIPCVKQIAVTLRPSALETIVDRGYTKFRPDKYLLDLTMTVAASAYVSPRDWEVGDSLIETADPRIDHIEALRDLFDGDPAALFHLDRIADRVSK